LLRPLALLSDKITLDPAWRANFVLALLKAPITAVVHKLACILYAMIRPRRS